MSKSSSACSSFTSCQECSSSYKCHWCSGSSDNDDGGGGGDSVSGCHTIGSWYGCAYGVDCFSIEQCQRTEPHHVGRSNLDRGVTSGLGLVVFVGMMYWFQKRRHRLTYPDTDPEALARTVELVSGSDNHTHRHANNAETPAFKSYESTEDMSYKEFSSGGGTSNNSSNKLSINITYNDDPPPRSSEIGWNGTHTPSSSMSSSMLRRLLPAALLQPPPLVVTTSSIAVAAFLAATTVAIAAYAPRPLQLNICTTEVAWKNILAGMMDLYMSASFNILVSVYNPNPDSVELDVCSGSFMNNGQKFGSFVMQPMSLAAQSITDDLVLVTFAPGEWHAYEMVKSYAKGTFNFTIDVALGATFPGVFNYSFDTHINDIFIDLSSSSSASDEDSKEPQIDHHLCKCQY